MLWLTIFFGGALVWAGIDALLRLGAPPYLTRREIAEAVYGDGAPQMSELAEDYARRRLIVQGSSLATLIACLFIVAGLAAVIGAIWLLLQTW
ncbi:MAG: hypothetical protein KF686_03980 [Ramlibacter sp.]|nr:hypothetical protein [Ramlibacter sp.]